MKKAEILRVHGTMYLKEYNLWALTVDTFEGCSLYKDGHKSAYVTWRTRRICANSRERLRDIKAGMTINIAW